MASQIKQSTGKGKTEQRVRHRIWECIVSVKKETKEVMNDLIDLGISRQKLKRWQKNPLSYVGPVDLNILKTYLSQREETGVENIDDLFVQEAAENILSGKNS